MKKKETKILALLLALVMLLGLTACGKEEVQTPMENLYTYEVTEPPTEPPVQISMPDYEMTYSGALKDVIVTEKLEDGTGLKFSVKIGSSEQHIFTLHYDSQDGDLVTVLTDAKGEKVFVGFDMASIPEGLNEEEERTFCRAQEAVNDIVSSLVLK